jgi:hypothetical protein
VSGLRNCGVSTTVTGKVARAAFGVAFNSLFFKQMTRPPGAFAPQV